MACVSQVVTWEQLVPVVVIGKEVELDVVEGVQNMESEGQVPVIVGNLKFPELNGSGKGADPLWARKVRAMPVEPDSCE